jgi:HD-like signal output (HDOD) protein
MAMRAVVDVAVHGTNLDGEAAYAAGLLSDVGASFLLWLAGERARAGKPLSETACLEGIRRQHEVLGAALVESWKLDESIVQAARVHHSESPPAPPELMWHVAVVSTSIAEELAPGDDVTRSRAPRAATIERAMSELRLAPSAVKSLTGTLQIELQAVVSALGT